MSSPTPIDLNDGVARQRVVYRIQLMELALRMAIQCSITDLAGIKNIYEALLGLAMNPTA